MKRFNRSSVFTGALLVLALIAFLPGPLVVAEEWNEISRSDARISLDAPSLRQAYVYHARRKVAYGIAEIGSWEARTERFPHAKIYAEILRENARFSSKFDLKNMTREWNFLKGKNLKFGGQSSYWNGLGQGRFRTFAFDGHECVAFRQFWGMVAASRGVDAGTRMLIGYYCNPSGISLSEQTIDGILDSIHVISSGELTAASSAAEATQDFEGKWIFEIADANHTSRKDRRVIEIENGKFSIAVDFDGWRGAVAGEITTSGHLTGTTRLQKMQYGRRVDQYEASYLKGEFHAKTFYGQRLGGGGVPSPVTFVIDLTKYAASSGTECLLSHCEEDHNQGTNPLPDNQTDLREPDRVVQEASIQSPESRAPQASGEEQQAALSQVNGEIGGEWVLEIREPQYMASGDKVTVDIVGGKFTAIVSADGWRGSVSGRIDKSGLLVASGYLRKPSRPAVLLKWSSQRSGNGYRASVPATTKWLSMTLHVSLYR